MPSFTPPVQEISINSISQYPDGRVNSLTAVIIDSLNNEYSLVIATAGKLALDAVESPEGTIDFLDEGREPVYLVAGNEILPRQIEEIVSSVEPELLETYLTPQL